MCKWFSNADQHNRYLLKENYILMQKHLGYLNKKYKNINEYKILNKWHQSLSISKIARIESHWLNHKKL